MSRPTTGATHRVLVNLCWLVPGVVGGSEESTTDALRALVAESPADLEFELAVLAPFADAHPDLAGSLTCHVAPFGAGNKALRVLVEQTWLAALVRRRRAELVHHAGGVVPLVHPGRVVLTIHDLQPLEHPENFSFAKRHYLDLMIGRSARSADVVCVPSRFTGERVRDLLGVSEDRIVHVPWPVTQRSDLKGECGDTDTGDSGPLYSGWSPERRFILYPSITYPHKRHLLLLDAFARIADVHPEVDLVLSGGAAQMEDELRARVEQLGLSGRVKRLGRVPLAHLEALYAAAALVAIPSAYEGFGLPALESMTNGVPLIAARAGSLTELLPEEWTVPGDDPARWAAAISEVLELGDADRAERCDRGRRLSAAFGPERTASALIDAYRLALGLRAREA